MALLEDMAADSTHLHSWLCAQVDVARPARCSRWLGIHEDAPSMLHVTSVAVVLLVHPREHGNGSTGGSVM